ncbi:MAG TPA: dTDP-4-dehydrorhamnose 3,5-epimerase family protein [Thermoanaerobaculia bacterium]|nr:dTDP-4-dehydrorhamnose 3,5-epimerase family protein [Thermoanaerobaculia bacterium]
MSKSTADHAALGAVRDPQTVTPTGEPVGERIAGVELRAAVTHLDDRGEICEIFDPAWGVHPAPLVYVYQTMVRPGKTKGWVVHQEQDDRMFVSLGTLRIVLYDAREGSPTHGRVNELFVSERNRALLVIPCGVFHAVQNIGATDAYFVNLPTRAYDHGAPDKYRLPIDTSRIPFSLAPREGG